MCPMCYMAIAGGALLACILYLPKKAKELFSKIKKVLKKKLSKKKTRKKSKKK